MENGFRFGDLSGSDEFNEFGLIEVVGNPIVSKISELV